MISVCIATYNGGKYLKEQLDSILCQLSKDDEIIISDDHSTDDTMLIINSFKDDRISVVLNEKEKGYVSNFENALLKAKGDYIFLADQDDIWLPGKVRDSLEVLKTKDFLVSNAIVINSNKDVIHDSFFNIVHHYRGFWKNIFKFSYLGCCMCFRRKVLEFALPFPQNRKLCTHDNWLFIVASFFYNVEIIDKPLILYRRHGSNTSTGAEKIIKRNSFLFMLKYRLYLVYNIFFRYLFYK